MKFNTIKYSKISISEASKEPWEIRVCPVLPIEVFSSKGVDAPNNLNFPVNIPEYPVLELVAEIAAPLPVEFVETNKEG